MWNVIGLFYSHKLGERELILLCVIQISVHQFYMNLLFYTVRLVESYKLWARSYKIGVVGNNWLVGCLVGWLVVNTAFSGTVLGIFLIFFAWSQLKAEKWQSRIFEKKFLIWKNSREGLQISPKSDTFIYFSKMAATIFLVFGLKLVLNMTFNFNEN